MRKNNHKAIITKIKKIVERECKKPTNPFGYGFWTDHILCVFKYARALNKKLKTRKNIVELAALLHDIGVVKGDSKNHHISGQKEAERILKKIDYPLKDIEEIKYCIYSHRASKKIKRKTIEAKCLASADALAHFDEIPQLFESAFIRFKMNPEQARQWVLGKLKRSWKKLLPEAKELVKDKYRAARLLLAA